jgi:hypothetical protein
MQNVTIILPLIQLLDKTAHQQYVITALANNQVRVQPTTADLYCSITHTLSDKGAEFHIFKPKDERNYRAVLKHKHYSVNPDDIISEIEKLGHKVAYGISNNFRQATTLHVFRRPSSSDPDTPQLNKLIASFAS